MESFNIGDTVIYVGISHATDPTFYPPVGTLGIVLGIYDSDLLVKWEDGSTSLDDLWYVYFKEIRMLSK